MHRINLAGQSKAHLVAEMWAAAPQIRTLLRKAPSLEIVRDRLFDYLNDLQRQYYNVLSPRNLTSRHIILRDNAKECMGVMKNIIRTENERLTGFSALKVLFALARRNRHALQETSDAFLAEFTALFKGILATADLTSRYFSTDELSDETPSSHSRRLDAYSKRLDRFFRRYRSGRDPDIHSMRIESTRHILRYFHATQKNWRDYRWHLKHLITDAGTLSSLVKLEPDEMEGLKLATHNKIPFQITPYYLSLFNRRRRTSWDRGVRAQVLPSSAYCRALIENRKKGTDMDFMGERATSPIDGITRRYAQIVILKPFDSCPQICVYCQRNWEITELQKGSFCREKMTKALAWIRRHRTIHEVLVTGGDPLALDNERLDWLLGELATMKHIERIRIGTRVLVTLPFRIDKGFLDLLKKYHRLGRREIAIMTHVEYPVEITDEMAEAVSRIRDTGVTIYNQQVFTYYTSRRYETCLLRKMLRLHGIFPYYTFNTKGKAETGDFRVPIARIEQERHEEARLLPGTMRTDEPVFNVPLQGKSSLNAWQDHEPIMVLADGSRVYRFYPWESRLVLADDYLYVDVPVYDYLKRLDKDGEDIGDYSTIWYYF